MIVFIIKPLHRSDEFKPLPQDALTAEAEDAATLQQAQKLKEAVRKFLNRECGRAELKKMID